MKTLQNFAAAMSVALCFFTVTLRAQEGAANYWPLKVGNTWTIDMKVEEKNLVVALTVTKVKQDLGYSEATVEYKVDDRIIQTEVYRINDTGISRASSGDGVLTPPFPIIKYPMEANKTWTWTGSISANGKEFRGESKISTSGPELLKLPGGEFNAIRVHSELSLILEDGKKIAIPNDYWFAPGVGFVQQKAKLGNLDVFGQLSRYKLVE